MLTYRKGEHERNEMSRRSINSLLEFTTSPYELILVDNTQNNRGLSRGRNWGVSVAIGDYLCFVDDDILFLPFWLEQCVSLLHLRGKFISTPIHQDRIGKWERPPVHGFRRNDRAGSNCMVMKRQTFEEVGGFLEYSLDNVKRDVRRTGCNFANRLVKAGYSTLITKTPRAIDLGFGIHSYQV